MAEKVKVSREVANFIKAYEDNVAGYNGWEDHLLYEHSRSSLIDGWDGVKDEALCMKDISPLELAEILIKGYEVEETPEEILLERYIQNDKNRTKAIQKHDTYQEAFALGYSMGVKDGLNFSGKIIKGINE